MTMAVPEDSVEEVLDFVKNAILDSMSAENTRQSTRSSSSRPPEDEAFERRAAAFPSIGVDEPDDAASPLSLVEFVRLIEDELVGDVEAIFEPQSRYYNSSCRFLIRNHFLLSSSSAIYRP
ncbi:hypothetical protein HPB48_019980 [Haemaphysalis longicornis]|uniref:Uncharacterized protein n=1 Tax=Haemaphysalis longicornis TaxID=44386 RepID=A0A9J6GIG8_HAELO|nr:hypothetical protein HPB48_019980 [Haemaphysalis longicornis]